MTWLPTRRCLLGRATTGVLMATLVAGCAAPTTTTTTSTARTTTAPVIEVGSTVLVDVSVATLWVSRLSPRRVDRPALRDPVDMRAWLAAMSVSQRLGLVGRVETQALYGDRLRVIGVTEHWLHVVAPAQPTSRDSRGYPGWVPRRQVTGAQLQSTGRVATVVRAHGWLRDAAGAPQVAVSYGTRLPVVRTGTRWVHVRSVTGEPLRIRSGVVAVAAADQPARTMGRSAVLRDALGWRGTPYLWGGRSGWAVDCSGFTSLVYAVHGVRLPRDADDQARAGGAVPLGDARRADLAFFTRGDSIGHVGFIAGDDLLLHAPSTGQTVSLTRLSSVSGFAGARRYLP
jgi:cell wall-associated NlpC family hydrolase